MSSSATRFPRAAALPVARELCQALRPVTERLIVAGSLRRRKPTVGDVEILYIPRFQILPVPGDLFATARQDLAALVIDDLLAAGVLAKRLNIHGSPLFGPKNKLVVHLATGIPVDLFATTEAAWWNYLVCRTGPAESNLAIANAALAKGWHWHPYTAGFTTSSGSLRVHSEREVFESVGRPYLDPWER